jgi:hypothetical protein
MFVVCACFVWLHVCTRARTSRWRPHFTWCWCSACLHFFFTMFAWCYTHSENSSTHISGTATTTSSTSHETHTDGMNSVTDIRTTSDTGASSKNIKRKNRWPFTNSSSNNNNSNSNGDSSTDATAAPSQTTREEHRVLLYDDKSAMSSDMQQSTAHTKHSRWTLPLTNNNNNSKVLQIELHILLLTFMHSACVYSYVYRRMQRTLHEGYACHWHTATIM